MSLRTLLAGIIALSASPLLVVEMFPGQLKFVMQPASYIVFHNIAEFFSVMVSFSMFGLIWYTYDQSKDRHALFLGTAFLGIGIMDFMHTLSMTAMPAFITPNLPNKSVQFWIAVRLFQAIAFLASAYVYAERSPRWVSKRPLLTLTFLVSSLVFIGIIYFPSHMPTMFVEGIGVTPLKKFLEYLIIALLGVAAAAYWRRLARTGERPCIYFLAAFIVCIFSELPLAFYARAFDTYNLLGHINKIVAFFLIYYGIFRASVKEPYLILAKTSEGLNREVAQRKRAEEELTEHKDHLEDLVKARTTELEIKNAQLAAEVAERKKAEQGLRDSEARANALVKYAPTGIYEIDYQGPRFISVNDVICQILGYTREELFSIGPSALLDDDSRALFGDRIRRQLAGEKIEESVEFRVRKKDGSFIDAILNVSLNLDGREPSRALVVAHDITERRRMEEELRRSRDELELRVRERTEQIQKQAELIDLAHDAIVLEEIDGTIRLWSNGAVEMYGWKKEEALGRIMRELLRTEYPLPRTEIMPKFLREGHWMGELTHTRNDGTRLKILSRWTLKRGPAGEPEKIMIINRNITERLKLEEQLRQAQRMESLGTLAGGIAHDFNNLLMPILLNTEMALLDIRNGELPSAELMETIMAGANRGKDLVQQIITFSRHKGEALRPVDIAPITRETVKFLRSTTSAAVKFETRFEDPNALVLANPSQIHQVLMNLVNNAAHSMEEQGGILEISLEKVDKEATDGMKASSYVCFTVKDTGCGMSPEVREKAFDPFFTTKAPGKGTGMGLAVVHGIVKKHGGEIRLESELGKGTIVSVFLPVYEEDKNEETPSPMVGIPNGDETILLIDDEEVQTRTVGMMLKKLGYRVLAESDPRKALERFRSQPHAFDVVITDQVMPYLSGTRLSQELLAIRPDIPIILCTGFSETVDEEKAAAVGLREYIQKPFTMNEISDLIRRALSPKAASSDTHSKMVQE